MKSWLQRNAKRIDRTLALLTTIVITLFCLIPLFWVFSTSLKPMGSEYLIPIQLWPEEPTLNAYRNVIDELGFLTPLGNSFLVSLSTAILCLVVSATAAYAVARLRFQFKVQSLVLLQLGAMIPPLVIAGTWP